MDITTQLQDFESRQRGISVNPDLSPEGRKNAMQRLTAEIANARPAIVRDLKIQWDALKVKGARNIDQVKQAENEAAQEWDYQRLEYMARSAKSTIANTLNIREVIGQYEQVKESGDRHAWRAWTETAGEAIKAKYGDIDARLFTKQLVQDARDLIETPKVKELKAQGSELTKQMYALNEQTEHAQKLYNPNNSGVFGLPDDFTAMREGVSISQKFIPETMGTETTVIFA